ncbi:hypothetical protein BU23DRAFT_298715 [Bimuria novae-zelandiae CBS 107.79]|uniref:Uncharacterized protein n=1 Tax=Bimuria novae-zelandiae CBS 107.79 TaxID=1447943 RepID=A0A6A5VKU7_9PLEO|nr:hypothetical protein BU23DRAFT_298715 [Bimuria novae-zelandiae CBS 107.79]
MQALMPRAPLPLVALTCRADLFHTAWRLPGSFARALDSMACSSACNSDRYVETTRVDGSVSTQASSDTPCSLASIARSQTNPDSNLGMRVITSSRVKSETEPRVSTEEAIPFQSGHTKSAPSKKQH